LPDEEVAVLEDDPKKSYIRRKAAYDYKMKSRKLLYEGDFDGLIISSGLQPETIVNELMKYMCGSRPAVIYSFTKEVLLQAAYWMRRSKDFLNAELTESFLREHQVLPGRMHPNMNMSAGGGYLLSALRVIDCPYDPAMAKRDNNNERRFKKKKGNKNDSASASPSPAPASATSTEIKEDTPMTEDE
jgi:tRNA (adenine-N(1)-)-methyltransferase non-catalytic subunit